MGTKKPLYNIPVEWLSRLAARFDKFVLLPFEFCCREVLLHSKTQMIRCQSLNLQQEYYVDKTFFHVGCGPCNPQDAMIEVFAATTLYTSLLTLMTYLETGLYVNLSEMVCALGRSNECLHYYTKVRVKKKVVEKDEVIEKEIVEYHLESLSGINVRKYLAHILVCKKCYRYIHDFLCLLDQCVEHHPFPAHREVANDGWNSLGVPILRFVLDADFDALRDKAFFGVIKDAGDEPCQTVDDFMCKYVIKKENDAIN